MIKKNEIAKCGACRFYTPVGRRGGECSQLSVPVQSAWKGCCLARSPFNTEMESPDHQLAELSMEAERRLERLPVKSKPFKVLESVPEAELFTKVGA